MKYVVAPVFVKINRGNDVSETPIEEDIQ